MRATRLSGFLLLTALGAPAQTVIQNVNYISGQTQAVADPVSITTGANVIVSSGANVTFGSAGTITLNPGFQALGGGYFIALLDGSVGSLQQTQATSSSASFSWTALSGSNAISYFNIYRNGVLIGTNGASVLNFTDTTVSPNSSYAYTVVAVDVKGNASGNYLINVNTPGPSGTLPSGYQVVLLVPNSVFYGIATGNWDIAAVTPH